MLVTLPRRLAVLLFFALMAAAVVGRVHAGSVPQHMPMMAGVHFAESSSVPAGVISRDSAVAAAMKVFSGPGTAQNVIPRYGVMTDDQIFTRDPSTGRRVYAAHDRAVWIVTFGDVVVPSFFPNSHLAPQQGLNVVIDAITGEYLFAYS